MYGQKSCGLKIVGQMVFGQNDIGRNVIGRNVFGRIVLHPPKGIRLKSFQYEMRAIFTESLIHDTSSQHSRSMGAMKHT